MPSFKIWQICKFVLAELQKICKKTHILYIEKKLLKFFLTKGLLCVIINAIFILNAKKEISNLANAPESRWVM